MIVSEKQKNQRTIQALSPHIPNQLIMWDPDSETKANTCLDCHKHIEGSNDCAHGEVRVCVVETAGKQLAPRSYRCETCGVEFEMKDLPKGVRIVHLIINDPAARNH